MNRSSLRISIMRKRPRRTGFLIAALIVAVLVLVPGEAAAGVARPIEGPGRLGDGRGAAEQRGAEQETGEAG